MNMIVQGILFLALGRTLKNHCRNLADCPTAVEAGFLTALSGQFIAMTALNCLALFAKFPRTVIQEETYWK
jgi:hypothetical protein